MLVDTQVLPFPGPTPVHDAADWDEATDLDRQPAHEFRRGIRSLASGVTVVTTADRDGAWYGIATTSVCLLSIDPPTLIVCLRRRSRVGQQLGCTRRFSVNVLSEAQRPIAEAFSGLRGVDRFHYGSWTPGTTGSPVLPDALASFECEVELLYGYPDHLVVTGSVQHVQHTTGTGDPLLSVPRQLVPYDSADALMAATS